MWEGLIFYNLDPKPKETLREHLGNELMDLYGSYPFEQTTVQLSYKADLPCSWPVLRDSQIDGYHLKYLHRRSAPGFMESEDARADMPMTSPLGRHSSGSFLWQSRKDRCRLVVGRALSRRWRAGSVRHSQATPQAAFHSNSGPRGESHEERQLVLRHPLRTPTSTSSSLDTTPTSSTR
ncbi:MAG: hypothetical protein IPP50_16355 [Piscinibacter sp.]|nr:hypothetical protein [Piscinibacter sp.]